MYYLFILESIGTSELILIGLVALIVFGPRKLPEFARTLGKMMNEFRRSTDDFKQTWAREVDLEINEKPTIARQDSPTENLILLEEAAREIPENKTNVAAPEIREINQTEFQESLLIKKTEPETKTEASYTDKRDWL